MSEPVVSISRFTTRVGSFVLGPLDMHVDAGEIVCLLGPNGAGKTTLLRSLLGLIPASSGEVAICGYPTQERKPEMLRSLGWVPDDPAEIIEELTARELWELHALAHSRVSGSVDTIAGCAFEIARHLDFLPPDAAIAGFSHGMRKKTQLAAALAHRPALFIADEPRNGLDPIGIARLERLLRAARNTGTAVLVASHDLHWAERVADRVVVLYNGHVVAQGSPAELRTASERSFSETFFRIVAEAA